MANSLTGRAKLLLGLAVVLVALMPIPVRQAGSAERTFRVEAGNYAYSPSVLSVDPGDRVTIELVATDVVHGLHIEGYDLSVSADPGQTARLSFVADRSLMLARIGCCGARSDWRCWRSWSGLGRSRDERVGPCRVAGSQTDAAQSVAPALGDRVGTGWFGARNRGRVERHASRQPQFLHRRRVDRVVGAADTGGRAIGLGGPA